MSILWLRRLENKIRKRAKISLRICPELSEVSLRMLTIKCGAQKEVALTDSTKFSSTKTRRLKTVLCLNYQRKESFLFQSAGRSLISASDTLVTYQTNDASKSRDSTGMAHFILQQSRKRRRLCVAVRLATRPYHRRIRV